MPTYISGGSLALPRTYGAKSLTRGPFCLAVSFFRQNQKGPRGAAKNLLGQSWVAISLADDKHKRRLQNHVGQWRL